MSFPEQPFGFVAGRWVLSIGDTPDDPDRAPDYVPVKDGVVVFTPQVTHRVAADGSGWAGIIKDRVLGGVGERGQLIDAEGHDHLALAVGVYSVSYDFGLGGSWPSHYIEVKPEHTADAPLWLPPIAPPAEGPRIENRVVTIPADGADGQVLVWDGAGFSWADPPKGDKGDQGEPGTSDIVVDTSVGTRVYANGVMLYGDTGWRVLSSWDTEGNVTGSALPTSLQPKSGRAGSISIRRIGSRAYWAIVGYTLTARAPFNTIIPLGYRPVADSALAPCMLDDNGTLGWVRMTGWGLYLNTDSYPVESSHLAPTVFEYFTQDPWPTTLPGLPG